MLQVGAYSHLLKTGKALKISALAEREGFEPPEVLPSTVFKTAAIDHSAISPVVCVRKFNKFFLIVQYISINLGKSLKN